MMNFSVATHDANSLSSALASFRSSVSKLSVTQRRLERDDPGFHPACPDRAGAAYEELS
jgi:hypothetical protein